ncbi:ABC transporter permease [Thalassospira sp. GB04J01]|uniref:ABC transporter permease n=1 Tax=Thalassospira sp. GB04J01 TaxID=1485225 RepID=UPI001FCC1460|nr:ABC transporter permease [Thalassospira sp. GB04J01]|tara:strand:- start:7003 stop:8046 length:1044 start_codon:yes stop_codon:yes gene_type:complete
MMNEKALKHPMTKDIKDLPDNLDGDWRNKLMRWETLLMVFVAIAFFTNTQISPYFLDPWSLSDATFNFTEKAIIALPMALLIIARDIDLSVASTIALASVAMGFANTMGAGPIELALIGMAVGTVAGFINGWIITRFDIPAIVVTIGTMSLYRGIAYIVLGDDVYRSYPSDFAFFGQGYVWGVLSFEFLLFLCLAVVFGILLHKTTFGRRVYAIGNNPTAALFSGINVKRHRLFLFTLVGLFAGIAAVLLTSRIGSTRPSIAMGWELEVITMVVLGGVNILGGAGSIVGVFIAVFLMGLVTFGMGLMNVPGIVMSIFTGCLLILVIGTPIIWRRFLNARKMRSNSGE